MLFKKRPKNKHSKKIKLLIVIDRFNRGGAELQLVKRINMLSKFQYSIYIYTIASSEQLNLYIEKSESVKIISPLFEKKIPLNNFIFRIIFRFGSMLKLIYIMKLYRPDITEYYLPRAYAFGAICGILSRRKIQIMSRRGLNNYQDKYFFLRCYEKWLHKHMTVIIGNSKAVLQCLYKTENVAKEKLQLIYNGIEVGKQQILNKDNDLDIGAIKKGLVLISIANLYPYKGHVDLLNALCRIKDRMPKNWKLLCVGLDVNNRLITLKNLAKKLGLTDNVLWLGQRNDVDGLLSISDISILCSHQEGLPNAILESMAANVPVIATDVGGCKELVINGFTGLLVKQGDVDEIAESILRLVNDGLLRKQFSTVAQEMVKEKFSLERCVEEYDALYRTLIKANSANAYNSMINFK